MGWPDPAELRDRHGFHISLQADETVANTPMMSGCYAVFHKQLGDLVLLEPALRRLQAHHGGSVRLLTRRGHKPLLSLMHGVRYCVGLPWKPFADLYAFDPLNKTALRSALAPASRKRCLLPERREHRPVLDGIYRHVDIPGLGNQYIAEYFWEHVPVPAREPFSPPQLDSPPAHWRPASAPSIPFVLLNPTAGWRKKSWIPEGWAGVVQAARDHGLASVMTSGPSDWQIQETSEIRRLSGDSPLVSGATTLREFLWLCANARAVVTVDGAASHLASAFRVPSLTLFGPTEIAHWHRDSPMARAIQADKDRDGVRRMRNLAPRQVLDAVGEVLGPRITRM